MNLGLLMNVSSSGMPLKSSISPVNNKSEGFGSVFQGLMSAISVPAKQQIVGTNSELTTLVEDVLNTDSLEKLEGMVEALKQSVKSPVVAQLLKESRLHQSQLVNEDVEIKLTDIVSLQKFPSLQQLAQLISEGPDKLIETTTNVLEDAGMTKEQFDQLAATGDIWFMLDVLQQLPTENIKEAMGQLPPKFAVELIALLKAVELAAAKMDLFTKQVDLVKTIQPIFSQIASQLEQKIIQPEVKHTVQIPSIMQNFIRISTEQMSADTEQQNHQSKPSETVAPLSAVATTETRPVFQMNATEKVPESRSEALMREFQAILNRANFGQTNGMNRISVKLYPEHLGQIRIELLEVNGVMTARILASTAMAREMLDSQMHQLRQAFNQQNLQVDRIDLSQTLQDPSKSDREQAFNKQNHQQKEQATEQNENPDEQEQTFQEFMIELEA
ncbi:flagellar hook-length control protein FliK [Sporosarcina sp. P16b]|uniref:flagellar hook-length control protein FliK n=1 Tax=Sporosarcina sp. P16b TaxID=2048261 RepID=UPI00130466E9|nr:flagellar hook-length control protein FliK [Sporosarcina sp. P16b]